MTDSEPRACGQSEGYRSCCSCKRAVPGDSIFTALLTVFLTLKLTGLLAWSWWWVLAPLWMPIGVFIVGVGAVFLYFKIRPPGRGRIHEEED